MEMASSSFMVFLCLLLEDIKRLLKEANSSSDLQSLKNFTKNLNSFFLPETELYVFILLPFFRWLPGSAYLNMASSSVVTMLILTLLYT